MKICLITAKGKRIEIDAKDSIVDAGVVVRVDTRFTPPERFFAYRSGSNLARLAIPVFEEVSAYHVGAEDLDAQE